MRPFLLSAAIAVSYAAAAPAQAYPAQHAGIKLSDVAGTWDGKTMLGPKDSVVATFALTATADRNGWTLKFPNRDPIPVRVLSTGGDNVVVEAGPYQSVLRPGQIVTTRISGHFKGDTMTGTFEAHYASGDVLRGKATATRRK